MKNQLMKNRLENRREFIFGVGLALMTIPSFSRAGENVKSKPVETNFVASTSVTANISSGMRPVGIIQVDVGIYTQDPDLKQKLTLAIPLLHSVWRAATQDYINRFYTLGMVPDAYLLQKTLQQAADPIIAPKRARVMIQSIIAR